MGLGGVQSTVTFMTTKIPTREDRVLYCKDSVLCSGIRDIWFQIVCLDCFYVTRKVSICESNIDGLMEKILWKPEENLSYISLSVCLPCQHRSDTPWTDSAMMPIGKGCTFRRLINLPHPAIMRAHRHSFTQQQFHPPYYFSDITMASISRLGGANTARPTIGAHMSTLTYAQTSSRIHSLVHYVTHSHPSKYPLAQALLLSLTPPPSTTRPVYCSPFVGTR